MSHKVPRSHEASVGVSRDESGEGTISQDGTSAGKLQGHSMMPACGCRSDRDGSIPEPVEAMSCPRVIAGKGETLPLLLRLTTRNSGKAQMPFCFWIWAYSELFAYRELGSGREPPSFRNGEGGKDEKRGTESQKPFSILFEILGSLKKR